MSIKQLIFRGTFTEKLPVPSSTGKYLMCWNLSEVIRHVRLLVRTLGLGGWFKAALKVLSGKRKFFMVADQGKGVHWGWVSISFCRYYPIQQGDVVIGPIDTLPDARGKGYATFALVKTINIIIEKGFHTIFINTEESNLSCLKVIAKCEFGEPVIVTGDNKKN